MDSRRVLSSVKNLTETLHGELIVAFEPEREDELIMLIGAMSLESFAERLKKFPHEESHRRDRWRPAKHPGSSHRRICARDHRHRWH